VGDWLGGMLCYGHSKPGFEIKFEITVFKIRDYSFRDHRIRGKTLLASETVFTWVARPERMKDQFLQNRSLNILFS